MKTALPFTLSSVWIGNQDRYRVSVGWKSGKDGAGLWPGRATADLNHLLWRAKKDLEDQFQ